MIQPNKKDEKQVLAGTSIETTQKETERISETGRDYSRGKKEE